MEKEKDFLKISNFQTGLVALSFFEAWEGEDGKFFTEHNYVSWVTQRVDQIIAKKKPFFTLLFCFGPFLRKFFLPLILCSFVSEEW